MNQIKSWKSFVMFSFVYMLHEGFFVIYTLASALVRLEVGLVGFGRLTGSVGLTGLGGGLVKPMVVLGLAGLAAVVVVVVVMVVVIVGLVAGFVGLAAAAGAGLAGVTGLVALAGAGLVGLDGFAGAVLVGLAGLVGLDGLAVLLSTCCSGPFS